MHRDRKPCSEIFSSYWKKTRERGNGLMRFRRQELDAWVTAIRPQARGVGLADGSMEARYELAPAMRSAQVAG